MAIPIIKRKLNDDIRLILTEEEAINLLSKIWGMQTEDDTMKIVYDKIVRTLKHRGFTEKTISDELIGRM